MNTQTAEILMRTTSAFYHNNSSAFAVSRKAPWPGWVKSFALMRKLWNATGSIVPESMVGAKQRGGKLPASVELWQSDELLLGIDNTCLPDPHFLSDTLSVFDVACGNLRFEMYASRLFKDKNVQVYALDNCEGMLEGTFAKDDEFSLSFYNYDTVDALLKDVFDEGIQSIPQCDISVSFGFMHHIPGFETRQSFLRSLVDKTRSGGLIIVSLWQFMNNEELASRTEKTHALAYAELTQHFGALDLDEGDYLMGWKNLPGQYRFCHHFSKSEIDALVASVSDATTLLARFVADGRTDNLNTYLILQKK